ncbi:uncharacterized protein LOC127264156 isoform X2 [Andrographis paniculata]|uniref:uncharacterized protein LOC127264156 isoform X2 n=1 Tax=Andrographis paniculata TaxID=175694 RepID=UPI0021E926F7|nr:uncharacterized protein LOC127264156 isoform X2 [Andrographis paniculata]
MLSRIPFEVDFFVLHRFGCGRIAAVRRLLQMEDTILTSEASSKSSDLNSNSRMICRVCEKQFSQYTCPRCNVRYCSLHCYKSHNIRCTESFMRENVMEELQQVRPNEQSKSKMLDILKRFHEEEETDSMDGEDSPLSEQTIQKILSGDQVSFDDLSIEEKKYFQRAVASGELSKLIKPWDPWWLRPSAKFVSLSPDGSQLIQSISKDEPGESSRNDTDSDQLHNIPPGPETPLPPISKLTTSGPSPLLTIHLVDILFSYCFTLRLYNGDWRADPLESATVVLSISSVLGQGDQPETIFEALSHCLEQTCSAQFRHMGGLQFGFGIIDDIIHLLYLGRSALVCLLCDMQKIVQNGEREVKSEKLPVSERKELKNKLKSADRKIYFIMCWVHEQPSEAWSSLAAIVNSEKMSATEYVDSKRNNVAGMNPKTEKMGKPLIKEV